ncbi:MAG: DUF1232 domain-containing protein [Hydrogenophaga sp.]|jgi:uncharacterized membrane protein YkvA (DUF1232 family)|nr:DUF1232 domain-containing protein [Hydrogenophaga sp.]
MWKRLSVLWVAVKGDARLMWHALRHPEAPGWLKIGAAALVLYVLSPVDLIPDVLPIIGVMDDLVLVPLAMRWLIGRLPPHIRAHAEQRRGGLGSARPTPSSSSSR